MALKTTGNCQVWQMPLKNLIQLGLTRSQGGLNPIISAVHFVHEIKSLLDDTNRYDRLINKFAKI